MTTHFLPTPHVLLRRSLRHIPRSPDTIITTAITPIAMLLLFVYVFGGAIDRTDSYVNYLLPGILLITIASGIAYTAFRLFTRRSRAASSSGSSRCRSPARPSCGRTC